MRKVLTVFGIAATILGLAAILALPLSAGSHGEEDTATLRASLTSQDII